MYKNQVLVNGKERKLRTPTTDDKQIALEIHEKAVAWGALYSTTYGKSVTANLYDGDNILYSVDYEY